MYLGHFQSLLQNWLYNNNNYFCALWKTGSRAKMLDLSMIFLLDTESEFDKAVLILVLHTITDLKITGHIKGNDFLHLLLLPSVSPTLSCGIRWEGGHWSRDSAMKVFFCWTPEQHPPPKSKAFWQTQMRFIAAGRFCVPPAMVRVSLRGHHDGWSLTLLSRLLLSSAASA